MFTRRLGICISAALVPGLSGCHSTPRQETEASKKAASSFVEGSVIQDKSDERVYFIAGNKRHYIKFPVTLRALGDVNQINVQPDSVVSSIPAGDDMPPIVSRIIQDSSTGKVYVLEAGKRHYVPDPTTLQNLHLTDSIQGLSGTDASSIPLGAPLAPKP